LEYGFANNARQLYYPEHRYSRREQLPGKALLLIGKISDEQKNNIVQILLWQNVGLKGYMPLLLYAIYLTWASFLNVVSSLIVDKVGRVRMLIIGMVRGTIFKNNYVHGSRKKK
jgi:hypothetical protein